MIQWELKAPTELVSFYSITFCAVNLWINAKLQEGDIENGGMGDNLCGWYDDRDSYAGFIGGFFYEGLCHRAVEIIMSLFRFMFNK